MAPLPLLTEIWPQHTAFAVLLLVFLTLLIAVIAFAKSRH